jgi:DNA-binding transcriptional LysR family regulator
MVAKLSELAAFAAVARHLSFQKAAIERGVSRSAVSHAIAGLEQQLGVRLLHRNNRSVSLTEAGAMLCERLDRAFADIDSALDGINHFTTAVVGRLRLNVPRAIGTNLLGPLLAELAAAHPQLSIEVSSNDAIVDIVGEGFDAGIRFAERLQQDMIAIRLPQSVAFAVVATPAYFAAAAPLQSPHDLAAHRCIRYRFPSGALFRWEFEKDGEGLAIDVPGTISLDDQELMIEAALAGAGIAFVFESRVQAHIASGRLARRLQDWCPELTGLHLYYSSRRQVSAGLRALIDLIRKPDRDRSRGMLKQAI